MVAAGPGAAEEGGRRPPKKKETAGEGRAGRKEGGTAPKAGGPPPLDATIDAATGKITVNAKKPGQQGSSMAKVGNLTALARVRVVPQIPYKQDFDRSRSGPSPAGG